MQTDAVEVIVLTKILAYETCETNCLVLYMNYKISVQIGSKQEWTKLQLRKMLVFHTNGVILGVWCCVVCPLFATICTPVVKRYFKARHPIPISCR